MNEFLYRMLRFFKIYSLPFLTIVVAFGIYYAIFEVTHAHKLKESARESEVERLALDDENLTAQMPQVPVEIPQPETPLPLTPSAPNLALDLEEAPKIEETTLTPKDSNETSKDEMVKNLSASSKESISKLYRVNVDVLNIRALPSTNARIIAKKSRGDLLEVSEIKGEWANTSLGWAYLSFITAQ